MGFLLDIMFTNSIDIIDIKSWKVSFFWKLPLCLSLCMVWAVSGCQSGAEHASSDKARASRVSSLRGRISVSGAFALYPLMVRWSEEFRALHPKVRIDISAGGAGKGITDVLSGMVDLGMVSREIYPEELARGIVPVAVALDAVVVATSASNPVLDELMIRGISRQAATDLWVRGASKTWGDVLHSEAIAPVHVYSRSDACGAAETWAHFLGVRQEDLRGVGVFGDPGAASAVLKDPVSLGYNNMAYVYDPDTRRPYPGMAVVPLDLDGNGSIGPEERSYDSLDSLMSAISSGRYPSPPARALYLVMKGVPRDTALRTFLRFLLTQGQKYAPETGFVPLAQSVAEQQLRILEDKR